MNFMRAAISAALLALSAIALGAGGAHAQSTSPVLLPSGCATGNMTNSIGYLTLNSLGQLCATTGGSASVGTYFYNAPSSQLVRASNTTAYAANETVCLLTSTTVCAPITIPIASTSAGKGVINHISLLKSGSSTTNASFTLWLYSAAPGTSSPSQYDATSYTGPRAADMPNYIGNAACTAPTVTSDSSAQVWYECTLSNPNTSGAIVFQALAGGTTINALLSVTAAYTPVSGETFNAYVSGFY